MERHPKGPLSPGGISAVLPAFNEEALIAKTVRHTADVLRRYNSHFEIVVVNDGSRDSTGQVLTQLQLQEPDVPLHVVTHSENLGYGAALASGFDAASQDL